MTDRSRITRFAAEGAVIVGSILLAFWIDAWWDGRQARVAEAGVLESVLAEVDQNRASLDDALATHEARLDRIDRFVRATPAELRTFAPDSVSDLVSALANALTYDPDLSATRHFLDASSAVTPRGREVREAAARWTRQLEDAAEEREALYRVGEDLNLRISRLALEAAPGGIANLSTMVARLDGRGIDDLRSDPDFMAAVVKKTFYQIGYLAELQRASELLDTLRATFR